MSRPKTRANTWLDALRSFDLETLQFASYLMDVICLLGGDVPVSLAVPKEAGLERYEVQWILNPPHRPRRIRVWGFMSIGKAHRLTVKGKQARWARELLQREITARARRHNDR